MCVCVFLVVTDVELVPVNRGAHGVCVPCCDRCGGSAGGQGGSGCVCVCVCVPCCDRCRGSAGGQGGSQCVFLVVTDVEVVPVDREALSVCSLL